MIGKFVPTPIKAREEAVPSWRQEGQPPARAERNANGRSLGGRKNVDPANDDQEPENHGARSRLQRAKKTGLPHLAKFML